MKHIGIINGPISENAYIVYDEKTKESGVIDPGFMEIEVLDDLVKYNKLELKYIINTHGHWDHIKNNSLIQDKYKVKILIHKDDEHLILEPNNMKSSYFNPTNIIPTKADMYLEEGEKIYLGEKFLNVLHTPGHSKGSVILYNDELAFTGDTLFHGSIGRCDLPGGDKDVMIDSLEKIKKNIPLTALVLPGHGREETNFGEELKINPFLTGKMKPR